MKKKVLWVGDAVAQTGFARATHEILRGLLETFEIQVLGLNYLGDPHDYPYKIYPAFSGGDFFGVGRIKERVKAFKPEILVIQNDPWNFAPYFKELDKLKAEDPDFVLPTVIAIVAVDGTNVRAHQLNRCAAVICWTEFAKKELELGGCEVPIEVIGLGVDRGVYKPVNQKVAREHFLAANPDTHGAWIVGAAARNSPRKRLDLTIMYFAHWLKRFKHDAYLWLHVMPTDRDAYDLKQLAFFCGLKGRVIFPELDSVYGGTEEELNAVYNCWNLGLYTSQGEGWGLPTLEAMAAGVIHVLPDNAAFAEWAKPAAKLVRCDSYATTPVPSANTVGTLPSLSLTVQALEDVYSSRPMQQRMREATQQLVSREEFRWSNIAAKYSRVLSTVGEPVAA